MAQPADIPNRRPWWRVPALLAGLLGIAVALDDWTRDNVYATYYQGELIQMFRVFGYFPAWVLASIGVLLLEWDRSRGTFTRAACRAMLLFWSPALSGLAAGLVKILVRRKRPTESQHPFEFRPINEDFFNASGLGFPSEHAAVAFAAAVVLTKLYPRGWPVWWLWAVGCGVTRLLARGHHLSDIVGALIVALAMSTLLWRIYLRRTARLLVREP